jgi:uncharacterized protein YecA (UPF0149 family)
MLLSELDGYLAGVLVCPDLIPPSEWLPGIWGEDEAAPLAEGLSAEQVEDAIEDLSLEEVEDLMAELVEDAPERIPIWIDVLNAWRLKRDSGRLSPIRHGKIGRNDPCPCGSGRKFKKCCGRT